MNRWFLLAVFFFSSRLVSQGLTPEQQQKVDSMMQWLKVQQMSGIPVDKVKLDSMNAEIRKLNVSTTKPDTAMNKASAEIVKQSMSGSSFTVPPGKKWIVRKLYVNDGGSYNILVTSIKYEKPLKEGEKLFTPTWCAEAELLNGDKMMLNYIFRIEESGGQ